MGHYKALLSQGTHAVTVNAPNYQSVTYETEIVVGQSQQSQIALTPENPPVIEKVTGTFSFAAQLLNIPALKVFGSPDWYTVQLHFDGLHFVLGNVKSIPAPLNTSDTATFIPHTAEIVLPWLTVIDLPEKPVYSLKLGLALTPQENLFKFELLDFFLVQ